MQHENTTPPTAPQAKLYNLSDLIGETTEIYAAAEQALKEGRALGPAIEFERLREELGGWFEGVLALHGGPGSGKTAWAIQTSTTVGCPAIYLTCEMPAATILRRIIANKTGEFLGRLRRGQISAETFQRHARTVAEGLPNYGIIDAYAAPCSVELLKKAVAKMRDRGDHLLVVVDSVHAWSAGAFPNMDEYAAVSAAVGALREIAAVYRTTVIEIIERNRASMKGETMHAGAATRKIEYGGDVIIALDSVGEIETQLRGSVGVNLTLQKNREGRPGTQIGYLFQGATQRFFEHGQPWPKMDVVREISKATGRRALAECEDAG